MDLNGGSFALDKDTAARLGSMLHPRQPMDCDEADAALVEELRAAGLLAEATRPGKMFLQAGERAVARVLAAWLRQVQPGSQVGTREASRLMSIAWFSLHLLRWPAAVRVWTMAFPSRATAASENAERIHEAVQTAAARHWLPVQCKERALSAFGLARLNGLQPVLHVGCNPTVFQMHCWASVAEQVLGDHPEHHQEFEPVASWS
ncbi:MAG: lasso peptide biosynthesis B2 protein [Limisphaerales bacterium]